MLDIPGIFCGLGPMLLPLICFVCGCIRWRMDFARQQWKPAAWYYGAILGCIVVFMIIATAMQNSPLLLAPAIGLMIAWFLALPVAMAIAFGRRDRPSHQPDRFCHSCHYDLTGNISGTCPECGKEIPPGQFVALKAPAAWGQGFDPNNN